MIPRSVTTASSRQSPPALITSVLIDWYEVKRRPFAAPASIRSHAGAVLFVVSVTLYALGFQGSDPHGRYEWATPMENTGVRSTGCVALIQAGFAGIASLMDRHRKGTHSLRCVSRASAC
jgi:hypothetical protein